MRELNKKCVYSLEDLTSEERNELLEPLNLIGIKKANYLSFGEPFGWVLGTFHNKETVNAKELFYTLENIQVDCSNETECRIREMINIFVAKSVRCGGNMYLNKDKRQVYLYINDNNITVMHIKHDNKTTITYEKFIEFFAEPQYEVTEKPQHYAKGIDTFSRMEANCTKEECLAFAKGNIDKYNFRTKGQDLEDYKKIISYAQWAIKLLENEKQN